MENPKKKSPGWFAKIMDNPLRAFVFWFSAFAVLLALAMIVPILIEALIIPIGACSTTAISFFRRRKVEWVDQFAVPLPNGAFIPITVYKEKKYVSNIYYFIILSLFSPFFYIPYSVRYHLVKGAFASQQAQNPGSLISAEGLFHTCALSKKEYLARKGNLQAFAAELAAETGPDREQFEETVRPFIQAGVMNEEWRGPYYSVLSFAMEPSTKALCFYSGKKEQIAVVVDAGVAAQFCGFAVSPAAWSKLLQSDSPFSLDAVALERLVRMQMQGNQAQNEGQTPAQAIDARFVDPAYRTAMDDINERKKPLTDEVIAEAFRKVANRKTVFGGVLCFLSLYGIIGTIAGVANGLIALGVISALFLSVCLFFGIKKILKGKAYKKIIREGNYRVEKATCVASKRDTESYDGLLLYVCDFDNGLKGRNFRTELRAGDPAYFAYLDEKHIASFSGLEYYRPM